MPESNGRTQLLQDAWLGDAVLSLYAREKILREDAHLDGDKYDRMTSNQFLSSIGEPSAVEAGIGRAYLNGGILEAFAWIDSRLMPVYARQEAKRQRHK